jgi:hypothetical protein
MVLRIGCEGFRRKEFGDVDFIRVLGFLYPLHKHLDTVGDTCRIHVRIPLIRAMNNHLIEGSNANVLP